MGHGRVVEGAQGGGTVLVEGLGRDQQVFREGDDGRELMRRAMGRKRWAVLVEFDGCVVCTSKEERRAA